MLNDMRFWASLPVVFLLGLAALVWRYSHHTAAAALVGVALVVGLFLALVVAILSRRIL